MKFVLENFRFFLFATAIHSFKLSRNHVDWHSVDEVYLYSDATTSKIARTVTQKLGFSKVLLDFQAHKLTCHCLMKAGKRYDTP